METTQVDPSQLLEQAALKRAEAESASGQSQIARGVSHRAMKEAERLEEQALREVRWGGTLGQGLAHDLSVALSGSFEASRMYHDLEAKLEWLIERLAASAEQPVVIKDGHGWQIGLVPSGGRPEYKTMASGLSAHSVVLAWQPTGRINPHGYSLKLAEPLTVDVSWFNYYMEPERRDLSVYVGQDQVEAWAAELPLGERLMVWSLMRQLGYPVEPGEELAAEIRRRREAMIVELLRAHAELTALRTKLAAWQANPVAFLNQNLHSTKLIEPTQTGVHLNFGLSDPIAKAESKLRGIVETARTDLLMDDNPTLQEAAIAIGLDLQS